MPVQPYKLPILYQDDHYIIINKPAGLMVHRGEKGCHAKRFAMQLLRNQVGRWVYPVHRLDRPTSGILVFGLDRDATRALALDFAAHKVAKSYLAVVRGFVGEAGEIDMPLKRDVYNSDKGGTLVSARTRFRCLATVELPYAVGRYDTARYSMVAANPLSGRMHQIRRHFKKTAHPLVGDRIYGDHRHNRLFRERFGWNRLLLAATTMDFRHPFSGNTVHVEAPLDGMFSAMIRRFGWDGGIPGHWLKPG